MEVKSKTDNAPRYLPGKFLTVAGEGFTLSSTAYPPGSHPERCPIVATLTAVAATLDNGHVRWFGFERAWINSELRMIVQGFDSRDEVRSGWKKVAKRNLV